MNAARKTHVSATPSALPECSSPPISANPSTATPNQPSAINPIAVETMPATQYADDGVTSDTESVAPAVITHTAASVMERLPWKILSLAQPQNTRPAIAPIC